MLDHDKIQQIYDDIEAKLSDVLNEVTNTMGMGFQDYPWWKEACALAKAMNLGGAALNVSRTPKYIAIDISGSMQGRFDLAKEHALSSAANYSNKITGAVLDDYGKITEYLHYEAK